MSHGEMVRSARQKIGETQHVFARRFDITQSVISRYEKGSISPSADVVFACLEILEQTSAANAQPATNIQASEYSRPAASSPESDLDSLIDIMRKRLSGAKRAKQREVIFSMLEMMACPA